MGFTNVAWESRSTEQLARDLTEGAGPLSMGLAGAAWVRVANELASVSEEYEQLVDRLKAAFVSDGAQAAAAKLDEFGAWLQAASLSAAGNGQRAEEAAAAYGAAVVAMPSVSEVVESRVASDVMASLAAYDGAVLVGRFAEFDDVANADASNASSVMYRYEDACAELAEPWGQPLPAEVCKGAAAAEESAPANGEGVRGGTAGAVAPPPPPPLAAFSAGSVKSSGTASALRSVGASAAGSGAGVGGAMPAGYGQLGALGRGLGGDREHEASVGHDSLDGGGEASVGLAHNGDPWLPTAQRSDAPFMVTNVSWSPDTSVFDEFAVAPAPLEPVVDQPWAQSPVIGADKGLTL